MRYLTPIRALMLAILALLLTALLPLSARAAIGDVFAVPGDVWRIVSTGHLLPGTTGTRDIGSPLAQVRAIYMQDAVVSDDVTVGGDLTVTGTQTVTGAQTFNGNVTIGNAGTDSATIVAKLYANDDVTIGNAGTDSATVTAKLYANDDVTIGNAGTDKLTVTAGIASPLLPDGDNTRDLGGAATAWKDLFLAGTATLNGSAVLGDAVGDSIDVNGTADLASVRFSGYVNYTLKDSAADYTVIAGTDHFVTISDTSAARQVNLPTAASFGPGGVLIVKDASGAAGTNNITITPAGAETIDGAASYVLDANSEAVRLVSTGTAWLTF